jgi:hypothetical protein
MRDKFLIFRVEDVHPLEQAGSEPAGRFSDSNQDDVVEVLRMHLVTRIGVGP